MASILFKRALTGLTAPVRRSIVTTPVRRSGADPLIGHVEQEAMPGANLPFQIKNRYRLALLMMVYFSSGFTAPFLVVRHQLLKKNA